MVSHCGPVHTGRVHGARKRLGYTLPTSSLGEEAACCQYRKPSLLKTGFSFLVGLQAPGAPLPIPSLLLSQQNTGPWPYSMLRAGGLYENGCCPHAPSPIPSPSPPRTGTWKTAWEMRSFQGSFLSFLRPSWADWAQDGKGLNDRYSLVTQWPQAVALTWKNAFQTCLYYQENCQPLLSLLGARSRTNNSTLLSVLGT